MSHILLITSSPRALSYSTRVARSLADRLAASAASSRVTVRDLTHRPLPHIDDTFAAARNLPPASLSSAHQAALSLSEELLQELFAADTIIIAAGMINFGIPSSLKAYIDYIVRPGVTFKYTEKGAAGLVNGKKVYLVLARGGVYAQGAMQQLDFQTPYLRASLGFIGLNDIEVIAVEGVAFGPEVAEQAFAAALARVAVIAA
jgi:FMN-dependent NADH-azoreductase